ncbi:MAG: hypothetical protein CMJ18_17840 [Phycisphaeraceae bacterium]|nr:hypothetical protein [Phycisphaeraceae bacterium]
MPDRSPAEVFWTPAGIEEAIGGRWLAAPDRDARYAGLGIDSRAVRPGRIFLAVRGERFDGHDFVQAARDGGADLVIGDDQAKLSASAGPALLVEDALATLQSLARAYRDRLAASGTCVIAVAGSNGKTTTRHLVHTALSAARRGTQSPASFNNHIGVPLTLLGAAPGDDFLVAEIGTNHPGEVARLAAIARPDVAVITSIGLEHQAFFDGLDAVAREQETLLDHVWDAAVISSQALEHLAPRLPVDRTWKLIRYGPEDAAPLNGVDREVVMRAACCSAETGRWRFAVDATPFESPLPGRHNVDNALAAVAVGSHLGLEDAVLAEALRDARPAPMRGQVMRIGSSSRGVVLINDAYNANPDSMRAALDMLAEHPADRRVAILGDMLELGSAERAHHVAVGEHLVGINALGGGIDRLVTIGAPASAIGDAPSESMPDGWVHRFDRWSADLPAAVAGLLAPGDVVLIKGSRGAGLERLVPAIEARFGQDGAIPSSDPPPAP